MKSILSMPETSGFIFEAKKKEIARRQNSYVLIYFIIRRAVACSGAVHICGSKTRESRDISPLTFPS